MLDANFRFCCACFCLAILLGGCEGAATDEEDGNDNNEPNPVAFADAILHYSFDDDSSPVAADNNSQNRFNGTIFAASRIVGSEGMGLDFSDTDGSHVHVVACCENSPGANSIKFNDAEITIAFWIRPANPVSGTIYPIFGSDYTGPQSPRIRINSNGNLQFLMYTHGVIEGEKTIATASPSEIPANTWTHVAVTYNGINADMYINGSLAINAGITITMPISSIVADFFIGGIPIMGDAGGGAHSFPGAIDEFVLFDNALTEEEIADLLL